MKTGYNKTNKQPERKRKDVLFTTGREKLRKTGKNKNIFPVSCAGMRYSVRIQLKSEDLQTMKH